MSVQWVHLGPGGVLVASGRGAWMQTPELGAAGITGPMPDSLRATRATTRHLLDGAIAVAEREAVAAHPPAMTARRWAWHLVGQWHCAHHSVALLPDLIDRYDTIGRADLADFARLKLDQERGHDEFPLNDLRALGYDADALVREVAPAPAVTAGLAFARRCARRKQPLEFLGYAYALERRVLNVSAATLAALDSVLPAGVEAASGIRSHANALDLEHVDEAVSFIAGLPARDRTRIALGAYRTAQILCAPFPQPSDTELDSWLARFQRAGARERASRR
jgi:hypothetical protein